MAYKILGISGSLRAGSLNTMLVREAGRLFEGAALTMADLNMPLYNGDTEASSGLPEPVSKLVAQIADADGVIISTPEYNSGITGVLKNALDWVSRSKPVPWIGKPVALMSAAAGRAGGIRAQTMLRTCMTPFSVRLVPASEVAVSGAAGEFGEDGQLISERYEASVSKLMHLLQEEIDLGRGT